MDITEVKRPSTFLQMRHCRNLLLQIYSAGE